MIRRKQRTLHPAVSISDLVSGRDEIVRIRGHCYVKDTWGSYAPKQVQSDVLTEEAAERFRRMTPELQRLFVRHVLYTPFLSVEGKQERLELAARCGVIGIHFEVDGRRMNDLKWLEDPDEPGGYFAETEGLTLFVWPVGERWSIQVDHGETAIMVGNNIPIQESAKFAAHMYARGWAKGRKEHTPCPA